MPRNIELKFRCEHLDAVRDRARIAGATDEGVLNQTDTFFNCDSGRLKLRDVGTGVGELIWYRRPDGVDACASDYRIAAVSDVPAMLELLSKAHGQRVSVRKRRHLFLWRNVRIHVDQVEVIGNFVELESVVGGAADEPRARENLALIVEQLGLHEAAPVAVAYADLVTAAAG